MCTGYAVHARVSPTIALLVSLHWDFAKKDHVRRKIDSGSISIPGPDTKKSRSWARGFRTNVALKRVTLARLPPLALAEFPCLRPRSFFPGPNNASTRRRIPLSNPTLILRLWCSICSHCFLLSPPCCIQLTSIRSMIPLAAEAPKAILFGSFIGEKNMAGGQELIAADMANRATIFRRMMPSRPPFSVLMNRQRPSCFSGLWYDCR